MRRKILLVAAIIMIGLPCLFFGSVFILYMTGCIGPPADPLMVSVDEDQMHEKIIEDIFFQKEGVLVIADLTIEQMAFSNTLLNNPALLETIQDTFLTLESETITSFQHGSSVHLGRKISNRPTLTIKQVNLNDTESCFPERSNEEEDFYREGLENSSKSFDFIRFSEAGFNSPYVVDMKEALIYVEHCCTDDQIVGSLYLFEKIDEEWEIKQQQEIWRQ